MLRYDITLNSRHINSDCAAKTLPQETFRFTCAQNKVSSFIWNNQIIRTFVLGLLFT